MIGPSVVPCRVCGGALRELVALGPGNAQLACDHCGAVEALPDDARDRFFLMRTLAAERDWAEDPLKGKLVAMLAQFEGGMLHSHLMQIALMGLFAAAGFIAHATTNDPLALLRHSQLPGVSDAALLELQSGIAFNFLLTPAIVAGTALGFLVGVVRARRLLRREIAPLVASTEPEAPGEPERCRRCGGHLPVAHAALRECQYCGATNVVSESGALRALVAAARASAMVTHPSEAAERFARIEEQLHRGWTIAISAGLGGSLLAAGALAQVLVIMAR